jgi:hypothetical protein
MRPGKQRATTAGELDETMTARHDFSPDNARRALLISGTLSHDSSVRRRADVLARARPRANSCQYAALFHAGWRFRHLRDVRSQTFCRLHVGYTPVTHTPADIQTSYTDFWPLHPREFPCRLRRRQPYQPAVCGAQRSNHTNPGHTNPPTTRQETSAYARAETTITGRA